MKRFISVITVLLMLNSAFMPLALASAPNPDKLTPSLQAALDDAGNDDEIPVYIILNDIDYDVAMEKFHEAYPEEYEVYRFAKEEDIASEQRKAYYDNDCVDIDTNDRYDPVDPELLQRGIEKKREIFAEEYNQLNELFIKKYADKEQQLFISHYSPMMIVSLNKGTIIEMTKEEEVEYIDLFVNARVCDALSVANQATFAAEVRDTYGNNGSGVKIGQIEEHMPDTSVASLQYASVYPYEPNDTSDHATDVATILVGTTTDNKGVAVGATLYSYGAANALEFYPGCEWLVDKGVNIINTSIQFEISAGCYSLYPVTRWVDHVAVQHDIHFVTVSGNTGNALNLVSPGSHLVTSPGMAYNAITVGGFNDNNNASNPAAYSFFVDSGYLENDPGICPEKPNLLAPAAGILVNGRNYSGTSRAAPQVSGVIAQLCNYCPSLKVRQTVVGAMLAAGCVVKIDDYPNTGTQGGRFVNYISGSQQISDMEGAGLLNAKTTRQVAVNGKYWRATINTSSFPYSQNVYISSTNNSLIRVAIFWLKRNTLSGTHGSSTYSLTEVPFTNLDLKVYAPNGTLVGTSATLYANFEIVQFVPTQTGNYRIEISKTGTNSSTKEFVGIAVW